MNILSFDVDYLITCWFRKCFKTTDFSRGRVDDLSFFEYLSPFCFLSIEFHPTFFTSYKILPYFVCYYSILIR